MRETEQYARNRNIEISGVEHTREENLRTTMANIAAKIGVVHQDQDIDVVHRIPSRRGDGPPKIAAQFTSRTKRDMWMKKKNDGGSLISKEVVPNRTGGGRVYLNSHLIPEWKQLLGKPKQTGRPLGF